MDEPSVSVSPSPCPSPALESSTLRRLLEQELALDSRDLRSHAWYHGSIPRHRAEEIVAKDGDFLVRDCASQPGNFVLTCRSKGALLHFVINKVVIQPDTVYERVQFQFEADAYDTVPDLVTFYVGSGRPISAASGARISNPQNRLYPLSYYSNKYAIYASTPTPTATPTTPHSPHTLRRNGSISMADVPPRLPSKQRSMSLTPQELNGHLQMGLARTDDHSNSGNSADGVISEPIGCPPTGGSKYSTRSLPRSAGSTKLKAAPPLAASIDVEAEELPVDPPPPKPSRFPSQPGADGLPDEVSPSPGQTSTMQRVASYHASGSDSGNGSGDSSAQSSAAGDVADGSGLGLPSTPSPSPSPFASHTLTRGVVIKNPRYHFTGTMSASCSTTTLKAVDGDNVSVAAESLDGVSPAPLPYIPSLLDQDAFQTLLLPALENKPLDGTALQGIRVMLTESGSRILANHLTRTDLDVTLAEQAPGDRSWDFSVEGLVAKSAIELACSPQGRQLRLDLIERTECLKLLVAATILTCPNETERAMFLNQWIQVAVDTKTALGNLYGFCGIMLGLCMPQVQRLSATWHVLRQQYTDSAFNFEAKLRPTLKSMNECTNPQAPNTTIPHLLPFCLLQERTEESVIQGINSVPFSAALNTCITPWESNSSDFGLGTMFAHLEATRKFVDLLPTFRRNAEIVLQDAKLDDLLLDMFRTEFQLKFLWGSRGAAVHSAERHLKFEQVLTVMSEKCEPSQTTANSASGSAGMPLGATPSNLTQSISSAEIGTYV